MGSREDKSRSCVVCGDRATGYNFHALTCEGCKGFFRRTASKSTQRTCPFAGSCEVSKAQRRRCPACRLQKCLDVGMRKDMILSAEDLALRRARQDWRRAQQAPMKEQKELIQTLLEAHTSHMATMFDHFVHFKPPARLFSHHRPFSALDPVLPLLTHFADIDTFMIQQIIKFAKALPFFRSLHMENQISLLKGAAVEICHIVLNTTFCLQTQHFVCGPLHYRVEDAIYGFQEEFMELAVGFHRTLKRLQLQVPEYVLMAAIALFSPGEQPTAPNFSPLTSATSVKPAASPTCPSLLPGGLADRPGVTQREEIEQRQEKMALTLDSYIKEREQQPRPRKRCVRETSSRQMLVIAISFGRPWGICSFPPTVLAPQTSSIQAVLTAVCRP
ncbi:nuclear receptor subfamily 1 group I member 3 isoform X2 [Fukomys damarensis]|uniref:nuclear receptor subfamily 1 group I member 3 isoform X2 n=1 Tax=Fukomys damarensis TaxID=885580 RepID=UPI0008FF34C1|nr:nuclear receptor subfamily 1 group I member 3 isoform X2 [Fukomys damarensis]